MPAKDELIELITLAFDGKSAVERSEAFNEWVCFLKCLAGASSGDTIYYRQVLGALLCVTKDKEVTDFFDFDLLLFKKASKLLCSSYISDIEVAQLYTEMRNRHLNLTEFSPFCGEVSAEQEKELTKWLDDHKELLDMNCSSGEAVKEKESKRKFPMRYYKATLIIKTDKGFSLGEQQPHDVVDGTLYEAISDLEDFYLDYDTVEELTNFTDGDLEALEWFAEVVSQSTRTRVITEARKVAVNMIKTRTGVADREADHIFNGIVRKYEESR